MRSYRPEVLFDRNGRLNADIAKVAPNGHRRMSANPVANGGDSPEPLVIPEYTQYAVEMKDHGAMQVENTKCFG